MFQSLQHHEVQHARLPCPLPSKKLQTFKKQTNKRSKPCYVKKQINKNACFIISRHFRELFQGQLQNPFKLPINSGIHISSEQRFIKILYDKLGNVRHSHDRTKAFFLHEKLRDQCHKHFFYVERKSGSIQSLQVFQVKRGLMQGLGQEEAGRSEEVGGWEGGVGGREDGKSSYCLAGGCECTLQLLFLDILLNQNKNVNHNLILKKTQRSLRKPPGWWFRAWT